MRVHREQADATQPDPIVRDNLGDPVPITAAEVHAIETYLGQVLRDLFASTAPRRKDEHCGLLTFTSATPWRQPSTAWRQTIPLSSHSASQCGGTA